MRNEVGNMWGWRERPAQKQLRRCYHYMTDSTAALVSDYKNVFVYSCRLL